MIRQIYYKQLHHSYLNANISHLQNFTISFAVDFCFKSKHNYYQSVILFVHKNVTKMHSRQSDDQDMEASVRSPAAAPK